MRCCLLAAERRAVTRILTLGLAGRPNGRLKAVVVKSPARPSPAKHAPPEVEHHD